jgi:predicted Zn finger-like uncharacterized protein
LFTQCSNCNTVFRLSAETLRAAGGQVRCGRCGEIFNALARLAEEPSVFPRRESTLEMEMRADEILQSPPRPGEPAGRVDETEEDAAAGPDVARLELISPPAASERAPSPPTAPNPAPSPPTALSRAPSAPGARAGAGAASADTAAPKPAAATEPPAADGESSDEDTSFEFTLPPGELDRVFVEVAPRSRSPIPAAALALSEAAVENPAGNANEARSRRARVSGFEVPEDVRREMLAGIEAEPLASLASAAPRPRTFFMWLGAATVLAVLLMGQILHENRAWLTVHAPLRGPLRSFYATLGIAVQVPANLSAYQLRQWGVTGDPAAAGTLRVRASILNTAVQLQPYPLLRVTLANRFGARIGTRDFEPAEYLGKPTVRMLAPGERADATLDIVDPGKDAEGFEIDVCLRGTDQNISCAGDAAQQVGSQAGAAGSTP